MSGSQEHRWLQANTTQGGDRPPTITTAASETTTEDTVSCGDWSWLGVLAEETIRSLGVFPELTRQVRRIVDDPNTYLASVRRFSTSKSWHELPPETQERIAEMFHTCAATTLRVARSGPSTPQHFIPTKPIPPPACEPVAPADFYKWLAGLTDLPGKRAVDESGRHWSVSTVGNCWIDRHGHLPYDHTQQPRRLGNDEWVLHCYPCGTTVHWKADEPAPLALAPASNH